MEINSEINQILAKVLICGMINLPVSRQTAGNVQYTTNGMEVMGYIVVLIYANLSNHFNLPL
eukprot:Gb_32649 [translate_table: standard]